MGPVLLCLLHTKHSCCGTELIISVESAEHCIWNDTQPHKLTLLSFFRSCLSALSGFCCSTSALPFFCVVDSNRPSSPTPAQKQRAWYSSPIHTLCENVWPRDFDAFITLVVLVTKSVGKAACQARTSCSHLQSN